MMLVAYEPTTSLAALGKVPREGVDPGRPGERYWESDRKKAGAHGQSN
jgi:hypothetical protein